MKDNNCIKEVCQCTSCKSRIMCTEGCYFCNGEPMKICPVFDPVKTKDVRKNNNSHNET